jgi:hypothetical protein
MTNEVAEIDPRLVQMRQVLLQSLAEKYHVLVDTITKIPMAQEFKSHAIFNINQGFMWAKEAITLIVFNFDKPANETITDSTCEPVAVDAPVDAPEKIAE